MIYLDDISRWQPKVKNDRDCLNTSTACNFGVDIYMTSSWVYCKNITVQDHLLGLTFRVISTTNTNKTNTNKNSAPNTKKTSVPNTKLKKVRIFDQKIIEVANKNNIPHFATIPIRVQLEFKNFWFLKSLLFNLRFISLLFFQIFVMKLLMKLWKCIPVETQQILNFSNKL